ncbi:MAG: hypothetical protein N2114_00020, partial [Candidatus Goldbacteria bacterium]|nr:hypothetical protein [Candidatus Goldiibacteriota bacterium]
TIASKFIMYVFREININNNSPKIFKGLGYYLIPEYHNNKIIKSFGLNNYYIEKLMNELKDDSFAIDAFFYLDTKEKEKLKNLRNEFLQNNF